jgi:hypothetical protein
VRHDPPGRGGAAIEERELPSPRIFLCPSICQRYCRDRRSSGVVANVAEHDARILYRGTEIASYNEPKA